MQRIHACTRWPADQPMRARLRVKRNIRAPRAETAQRTRRDRAMERPTAHGPDGERARGRRAAGSWRNERPMWRRTSSRLAVDPSWASGDLAPNRPVGMQKSGAKRANRTKPPRAGQRSTRIRRSATADSYLANSTCSVVLRKKKTVILGLGLRVHYRREGVRRPVSHLSSSQSEQLRGPVGGWRLHGRAVVCGRARDGNGCLVPAECRPPRRGDPVHGPKWFVPIRLPATNQMLQACRGRTSRISFLFRNQEGSLSVSGRSWSLKTHRSRRTHTGTRRRAAAVHGLCPGTHPGLLGRVDQWPGTHARISCPKKSNLSPPPIAVVQFFFLIYKTNFSFSLNF